MVPGRVGQGRANPRSHQWERLTAAVKWARGGGGGQMGPWALLTQERGQ